jgi:hypothetical protein
VQVLHIGRSELNDFWLRYVRPRIQRATSLDCEGGVEIAIENNTSFVVLIESASRKVPGSAYEARAFGIAKHPDFRMERPHWVAIRILQHEQLTRAPAKDEPECLDSLQTAALLIDADGHADGRTIRELQQGCGQMPHPTHLHVRDGSI